MINPSSMRRKHTAQFKVQVALEIIKQEKTLREICSQFSIHPTQARCWKEKAIEGLEVIFSDGIKSELKQKNELIEQLYLQIGKLKVEGDFLKKKIGLFE